MELEIEALSQYHRAIPYLTIITVPPVSNDYGYKEDMNGFKFLTGYYQDV